MTNSVFIHVPRTGGLWFGAVVERCGIKHQKLKGDIDSHIPYSQLPDNWKSVPHSFGFIRHPLAWAGSRWSHSLNIDAYNDFRYYGVHRLFDQCVRPTFAETLEVIMSEQPGLVGLTFATMLSSVRYVFKTEQLVEVAVRVLSDFEGLDEDYVRSVAGSVEKFNVSSALPPYEQQIADVPSRLARKFVNTEESAVAMWQSAIHLWV